MDQQRFVGRTAELAFFDGLLVDDPPASVVLVHGPGGIGKSTLLREVGRRAAASGRSPRLLEAPEVPPAAGVRARGAPARSRPWRRRRGGAAPPFFFSHPQGPHARRRHVPAPAAAAV